METPNLVFIKKLSEGDQLFENNILDILKKEFLEECNEFNNNISEKNYDKAAFNVHKIKHKIGLLGMQDAFELSTNFENELKKEEIKLHPSFLEILDKIHVFLSKLKIE